MSQSRPTLGSILTKRIAFFAILAMFVQLAVVFSDYYWNVGELSRLFVEQETERLAAGIIVEDRAPDICCPTMCTNAMTEVKPVISPGFAPRVVP